MNRLVVRVSLLGLLLLALAHPAFAQTAPAAAASADTVHRTLPLRLGGSAGIGWMQAPTDVRKRYKPGIDGDVELALRGKLPIALSVRAEYHDFPSAAYSYAGYYYTDGSAAPVGQLNDLTTGRAYDVVLAPMLRVVGAWWADAGIGYGYFDSGYAAGQQFIDGATGQIIHVPGSTGWGRVTSAGLRYEFQPTARDRMHVGARWSSLVREDHTLQLLRIAVGYRFL